MSKTAVRKQRQIKGVFNFFFRDKNCAFKSQKKARKFWGRNRGQ